jgi:tripartite-type tricarboxylate transporter receptor subunit TctC
MTAQAQTPDSTYPTRTLRLIVGFPPGGTTDVLARLVSSRLAERLGQAVVVENRAGASGMIGTDSVAKAPADGYTLLFSSSTLATYKSLYAQVPFDPVKDFVPVSLVASTPYVIVAHPSLPVASVSELVKYAEANPGQITYAASVPGGGSHLAGELFKQKTKTNMLYVPYKGSGVILPDLLSGRLQMAIENVTIMTQHIRSGAVRGIAVTGTDPSSLLPELPTVAADIPGFRVTGWFGIFAPAATPEPIVAALTAAVKEVVASEDLRRRMAELGAEPESGGNKEMRELLDSEITTWSAVIKEAGVKLQ